MNEIGKLSKKEFMIELQKFASNPNRNVMSVLKIFEGAFKVDEKNTPKV